MKRFVKRGTKQNRMRHIWKAIKEMYAIADNESEFADMCECFFYSDASSEVDMPEYEKIVKTVIACQ